VFYPISHAPRYPSAQEIQKALKQARLTPTELSVEHVETLLNVLVLDGDVEKVRGALLCPSYLFMLLALLGWLASRSCSSTVLLFIFTDICPTVYGFVN
jgi:hypothetical protein